MGDIYHDGGRLRRWWSSTKMAAVYQDGGLGMGEGGPDVANCTQSRGIMWDTCICSAGALRGLIYYENSLCAARVPTDLCYLGQRQYNEVLTGGSSRARDVKDGEEKTIRERGGGVGTVKHVLLPLLLDYVLKKIAAGGFVRPASTVHHCECCKRTLKAWKPGYLTNSFGEDLDLEDPYVQVYLSSGSLYDTRNEKIATAISRRSVGKLFGFTDLQFPDTSNSNRFPKNKTSVFSRLSSATPAARSRNQPFLLYRATLPAFESNTNCSVNPLSLPGMSRNAIPGVTANKCFLGAALALGGHFQLGGEVDRPFVALDSVFGCVLYGKGDILSCTTEIQVKLHLTFHFTCLLGIIGEIWAALNSEELRADEGEMRSEWSSAGKQDRRKREIPDKSPPASGIVWHDSYLRESGSEQSNCSATVAPVTNAVQHSKCVCRVSAWLLQMFPYWPRLAKRRVQHIDECSYAMKMHWEYEDLLLTSTIMEPRTALSLTGCHQCRLYDRVFTYVQNACRHERAICTKKPFRAMTNWEAWWWPTMVLHSSVESSSCASTNGESWWEPALVVDNFIANAFKRLVSCNNGETRCMASRCPKNVLMVQYDWFGVNMTSSRERYYVSASFCIFANMSYSPSAMSLDTPEPMVAMDVPSTSSGVVPAVRLTFSAEVPKTLMPTLPASLAPAPTSPTGPSEKRCQTWRRERTACSKRHFRAKKHYNNDHMQYLQSDTMEEHIEICKGSSTANHEDDNEDSIGDDYDDSDSVEDNDDSIDIPTYFTNKFPSTSGAKKAGDVASTDNMFTKYLNELVTFTLNLDIEPLILNDPEPKISKRKAKLFIKIRNKFIKKLKKTMTLDQRLRNQDSGLRIQDLRPKTLSQNSSPKTFDT
ncbi:hypothetical protein PR048_012529 [Dryococelus australis]|uniref:Uncharacterized protein n=1 Tax=Dryococelus australis TaxID=614101 RepID=A0ABQ9HPM7_9NEOP|nr:hypothetical protein PR048_012529 [Dryococelus australis]